MSFAPPDPSAACPCGRLSARRVPQAFGDCCGRYIDHFDTAAAPDAEHLMRSRYSAFVLQRRNYLQATWHASTRPAALTLAPGVQWLGLQVRAHRRLDDTHAEVEFVARSRTGGARAQRLHERSRFVREPVGGVARWLYLDGDLLE